MQAPPQISGVKPGKMKIVKLLCLLLLLWVDLRVNADEDSSKFIRDIMSTFRLRSPTIIYNEYEAAPDICYYGNRVLCLHPGLPSWYPKDETKSLANKSEGKVGKDGRSELHHI